MTVSYTAEVATCKGFGCFVKLLFRWRGSIYKLVWPDLFLFLGIYFSLSGLYRFFLSLEQQIIFEKIVRYCEKYGNLIPVSFVLGFYVSIVVRRWWDQYKSIPWPDSIAVFVSANIQGQEEKGRVMRRTIMRYCCLTLTMTFTLISPRVKRRFPTLDHLVEAGLLLENERDIIEELNRSVPSYSKHWLPVIWASSIVTRARKEGKIRDDSAVKSILEELNKLRSGCGTLTSYDWISVPLVYTQVVTLAVYSYFLACLMGRQWLRPERRNPEEEVPIRGDGNPELDLIFPIFTTLQFFFYMGWLKVAESLVNPFGDVSYLIVDEMHNNHPELLRDQYWDEVFPAELPHTVASEMFKEAPPSHSTANIYISKVEEEIVSPPSAKSLLHMSESGIFMRPTIPKSPVASLEEELTLTTDDGEDIEAGTGTATSPIHHNNPLCKGHPQLPRATHSFPVRMDDQAARSRFAASRSSLIYSRNRRSSGPIGRGESEEMRFHGPSSPPSLRHQLSFPGTRISTAAVAPKRGNGGSERRVKTASSAHSRSRQTILSTESMSSEKLAHAGSVTSLFRRIFSQENKWGKNAEPNNHSAAIEAPLDWSGSPPSIQRNVANDVIPELDENMATITSMRKEKKHPTVYDIFGSEVQSAATAQVDIPTSNHYEPVYFQSVSDTENFFKREESTSPDRIASMPIRMSFSAPAVSSQNSEAVGPSNNSGNNSELNLEDSHSHKSQHSQLSIVEDSCGTQMVKVSSDDKLDTEIKL